MATNSSRRPIDTTPKQAKPRDVTLIHAAIADVPAVLGNMDGAEVVPGTEERSVPYRQLVKELVKKGHGQAASAWAIHALAEEGKLLVWRGESAALSWKNPGEPSRRGGVSYLSGLESSDVESTPQLWEHPSVPKAPIPPLPPHRPATRRGRKQKYDPAADDDYLAKWANAQADGKTSLKFEEDNGDEPGTVEKTQARVRDRAKKKSK